MQSREHASLLDSQRNTTKYSLDFVHCTLDYLEILRDENHDINLNFNASRRNKLTIAE